MAEYIDKAELIKALEGCGYAVILSDSLPRIDIVRCGECKYAIKNPNTPYGMFECIEHHDIEGGRLLMLTDDYCADGERSENELE